MNGEIMNILHIIEYWKLNSCKQSQSVQESVHDSVHELALCYVIWTFKVGHRNTLSPLVSSEDTQ